MFGLTFMDRSPAFRRKAQICAQGLMVSAAELDRNGGDADDAVFCAANNQISAKSISVNSVPAGSQQRSKQ